MRTSANRNMLTTTDLKQDWLWPFCAFIQANACITCVVPSMYINEKEIILKGAFCLMRWYTLCSIVSVLRGLNPVHSRTAQIVVDHLTVLDSFVKNLTKSLNMQ